MSTNYIPPLCQKAKPAFPVVTARFFDPYAKNDFPDSYEVIDIPAGYRVSDVLGSVIQGWCQHRPILISAPTGSGKSTFAADIIRLAKERRQKVLILSHRTVITTQQKRELSKALQTDWAAVSDPEALRMTDTFDNFTVLSYQSFVAKSGKLDWSSFAWVIFDEVHFFSCDALFSPSCEEAANMISEHFAHAKRIYMTATPEQVFKVIERIEGKIPPCCGPCIQRTCSCGQILTYRFQPDYSRFHLRYFRQDGQMEDYVKEHSDEKFLWFVDSAAGGKQLAARLKERGVSAAYLDAEQKRSVLWRKICTESRFDENVLICTRVLDAGANLNDAALKNIVVGFFDRQTFLQALGRKRCQLDEQVNVFIPAIPQDKAKNRLSDMTKRRDLISAFENNSRANGQRFLYLGWDDAGDQGDMLRHVFALKRGRLTVRETVRDAVGYSRRFLLDLSGYIEEYGDSAYPRFAHNWVDDENGYDESNWLDYDCRAESMDKINEILGQSCNLKLTKDKFTELSNQLKVVLQRFRKWPHTERDLSWKKLQDLLDEVSAPFLIQKHGTGDAAIYEIKKKKVDERSPGDL